jgi:hypothetical protein
VLLLVQQLEHGFRLLEALGKLGAPAIFARGGNLLDTYENGKIETRDTTIAELNTMIANADKFILIGSSGVLDEGVDIVSLNCLFMAGGMKKHRRTLQRLGRIMRPKGGDNEAYTFDFLDRTHGALYKHSKSRMAVYEYEGHPCHTGLDHMRSKGYTFDLSRKVEWPKWFDNFPASYTAKFNDKRGKPKKNSKGKPGGFRMPWEHR